MLRGKPRGGEEVNKVVLKHPYQSVPVNFTFLYLGCKQETGEGAFRTNLKDAVTQIKSISREIIVEL